MANNIFSFPRFGILFRKHLKENIRKYLLFALMLFGIEFLLQGFVTIMGFNGPFNVMPYKGLFTLSLLFGITIFTSLAYSFFGNKAKGIQFLQLPASEPEKLLITFITTQIFFFITFLVCFYSVNWIMCTLYNSLTDFTAKGARPETLKYYKAYMYDCTERDAKVMIIISFILSAAAHFGSLAFEKNAYVKTSLIAMTIMGLIIWLNYAVPRTLVSHEQVMPYGFFYNSAYRIGEGESFKGTIKLPLRWQSFINYFLPLSLYICFWAASFFKLKEKQV